MPGSDGMALLTATAVVAAGTGGSPQDLTGTANIIPLDEWYGATAYMTVQGANAGSNGNLTLYFQTSHNGTQWWDMPVVTIPVAGADVSKDYRAAVMLNLNDAHYIRLARAGNSDATYAINVSGRLVRKLGSRLGI